MLFIPVCLVMVVVVSYLMFRNIQGVVLPLVSVMFIVIWGLGILHLCGGKIDVLTNSLPILVMIIGVADSIHLLGRYDEEIQRGLTRKGGRIRSSALYRSRMSPDKLHDCHRLCILGDFNE